MLKSYILKENAQSALFYILLTFARGNKTEVSIDNETDKADSFETQWTSFLFYAVRNNFPVSLHNSPVVVVTTKLTKQFLSLCPTSMQYRVHIFMIPLV